MKENKINKLPKNVYELIAAGEVIERPASILKELIENSIDAGAKSITIEIKHGGTTFLRITDDGEGISFDDLPVAFIRHATSKIKSVADLRRIFTMGFRGEALASVCAVSKVECISRTLDETGGIIQINGGETVLYEEQPAALGTTITVRDLFYNYPVRRDFLKSDVAEGNACQLCVDKAILSNPKVSIKFLRDGRLVRITGNDGKLAGAMKTVLGEDFLATVNPAYFEEEGKIKVSGYITRPTGCKPSRLWQYFFVNGRSVRSFQILSSLEDAYKNTIMTGKYPGAVIFVEIDPSKVDVNASPNKTEVRFSNEKDVGRAVYWAVRNGLDYKKDSENQERQAGLKKVFDEYNEIPIPPKHLHREGIFGRTPDLKDLPLDNKKPKEKERLMVDDFLENHKRDVSSDFEITGEYAKFNIRPTHFLPIFSRPNYRSEYLEPIIKQDNVRVIAELWETYILCEHISEKVVEFVIIDKHAAHERLKFNNLQKELFVSAQLLPEITNLKLPTEYVTVLLEQQDKLLDSGIEVAASELGGEYIELISFTDMVSLSEAENLIVEIAENLLRGANVKSAFDDILHTIACKAAVKSRDKSEISDMTLLAELVIGDEKARYCPHGRPVMRVISKKEMEKFFARIV